MDLDALFVIARLLEEEVVRLQNQLASIASSAPEEWNTTNNDWYFFIRDKEKADEFTEITKKYQTVNAVLRDVQSARRQFMDHSWH